MSQRPPAVAGTFYPSDPVALRQAVEGLLKDGAEAAADVPKAIIVPHAGLQYSGPVAATAYRRLLPMREQIRRVVLFGPAHRTPINGLGASSATEFETPLGAVPVDVEALARAANMPQVEYADAAHRDEHSLEVQLPFLQVALERFEIVPFVVGSATGDEVAEVIELLWDGPETLIVVSSDLSHFHDHATAVRIDGETAAAVVGLRADDLDGQRACGYRAIAGLIEVAAGRGLRLRNVDLRDSSQTAGDPSRVVGYGAFVAC